MDAHSPSTAPPPPTAGNTPRPYVPGIAPIKAEFLLHPEVQAQVQAGDSRESRASEARRGDEEAAKAVDSTATDAPTSTATAADAPAPAPAPTKLKGAARKKLRQAEARARREAGKSGGNQGGSQNKRRKFFNKADEGALCHDVAEGKRACPRGEAACTYSHALGDYLKEKSRDVYLPVPPLPPSEQGVGMLLPRMFGAVWGLDAAHRQAFIEENYTTEEPYVKWGRHTTGTQDADADADAHVHASTTTTQSLDERTTCPIYGALTARPIWDVNASKKHRCPYGFRCRFLGGHVHRVEEGGGYMGSGLVLPWQQQQAAGEADEADGEADDADANLDFNRSARDETNYVRPGLSRMLRKKEYPLYRTKAVLDLLAQEDREFQRTNSDDTRGPLVLDIAAVDRAGEEAAKEAAASAVQPTAIVDEDDLDALVNARSTGHDDDKPDARTLARAEDAATSQSTTCIDTARIRRPEKRRLDWHHGELYLAPLTTTGNLPFRRICASFGSDIHCGEMGLAGSYLEGNKSEWSLVRRWEGERTFGIQLCGSKPELLVPTAEIMAREFGPTGGLDFVDINCGCPIDLVFNHGGGSALLDHPRKLGRIVRGMDAVLGDVPVTVKLRTGVTSKNTSHARILPRVQTHWGAGAVTMHGRSRKQRYSKRADWEYIRECGAALRESVRNWNEESRTADEEEMLPVPFYGNGDVYSQGEYYANLEHTHVDGEMLARGALIKPWLFTEIKERRDWDISSRERLDIIRQFCAYGLTHWGSDTQGVNKTRRFLCEALSFMHRYVPLGLLEHLPPSMNDRPPLYRGRDDLETLLASDDANDWVKISEMFLGKCSGSFEFVPKHKSNSYAEGGAEQQG